MSVGVASFGKSLRAERTAENHFLDFRVQVKPLTGLDLKVGLQIQKCLLTLVFLKYPTQKRNLQ